MATHIFFSRVLPKSTTLPSLFSRTLTTTTTLSFLRHLRPLSAATTTSLRLNLPPPSPRRFLSTRATSSSLYDPKPSVSNRTPKEPTIEEGCDYEHWLVVMETPEGNLSRDEIIDNYIKTLTQVVGSEQEARMKIYLVSTRYYYAFGALVSEELAFKLKDLPKVRGVLPDSYLNVKEKDYGGEPFINGQAVPYDPKYHDQWIRNSGQAWPRNADRSRNFDRRREDVVSRDMQKPGSPPLGNAGGLPSNNTRGYAPPSRYTPANNTGRFPPQNAGSHAPHHIPQGNYSPHPPVNSGYAHQGVPQNNYTGNMGGVPPNQNMGGVPTNAGWSNTAPNRDYQPPNMGVPAGGNPYTS